MVVTIREMRVLETNCIGMGIPLRMLMEAAGLSVARIVEEHVRPDEVRNIVVLVGKGGNGGDALVAARYLSSKGYNVTVLLAYPPEQLEHPDTKANYEIISRMDTINIKKGFCSEAISNADVLIDGLLGTGVRGELREPIRSFVEESNRSKAKLKIAIDTPTGLDPDTGEVHGVAFKANITVTFHDIKPGLVKNRDIAGKIIVANIGIPREAEIYVGPGDIIHRIPKKPADAHKGVGGRILVIGGSKEYTGAPALVGMASLASGADLAFIATPSKVRSIVASYSPEIITLPVEGEYFREENLDEVWRIIEATRPHVIAIGNGIGREEETLHFTRKLLEKLSKENMFLVIDADALKSFKLGEIKFKWKAVLTPHRGEYKKLTNKDLPRDINEAVKQLTEVSREFEATILLKAPVDIIVSKDGYKLNKTGNPGMSIGGTGDVLVGIVAAFLARTKDPFVAAYTAAYINGLAGDYIAYIKKEEPAPTKIVDVLPYVINNVLDIHVSTYIKS